MNNDQMTDREVWVRAYCAWVGATHQNDFETFVNADAALKAFRERFPKVEEKSLSEGVDDALRSGYLAAHEHDDLARARAIIEEAKRSNMEGLKQAMKLHEGHKALDLNDDGSHRHAFNHPQAGCVHCGRTAFEIATSAKSKAAPDASEVVEAAREVLLGFVTIGMNEDTRMCQIPWQSMVKLEKAMHKFRLERTK